MARLGGPAGRRAGVWATTLALWRLYQRIPPKHRKRLLRQARTHGPRLAKQVYQARRRARRLL